MEAIDGVITISKEPDFLVSVTVKVVPSPGGPFIVLAATSNGKIPDGVAIALLRGDAKRHGIENVQHLLDALITIGSTYVTAGTEDRLPSMCEEIVSVLDATILADARKLPTDSRDPNTNFANFLRRMGARPIVSKR